jgi:CrcB protein
MGGFTTYSSFNLETTSLFLDGHELRAALNLAVTVASCVLAGLLGMLLARRLA